jgi:hypothetical protein
MADEALKKAHSYEILGLSLSLARKYYGNLLD